MPRRLLPLALCCAFTLSAGTITITPGSVSGTEGSTFNGIVGSFTDFAPLASPSDYSVVIDWGDGSANSVGTVTQPGGVATPYNVSASHTYTEEGSYTFDLTVQASASAPGSATISDAPLSPGLPVNGSGTEGVALNTVLGSFTDADPLASPADFSATIAWGDSTQGVGVISQPGGVGTPFFVSGTHTYAASGSFDANIHIMDDGGSTAAFQNSETIVPEPGTFLLCLAGMLMGGVALRRRGKSPAR